MIEDTKGKKLDIKKIDIELMKKEIISIEHLLIKQTNSYLSFIS